MIIQMSKYAFLVYHKEYSSFLNLLQSLGVVHVDQKAKPQEEGNLKAFKDDRIRIASLIRWLTRWQTLGVATTAMGEAPNSSVIADTELLLEQHEMLTERVESLKTQVGEQEVWGDFSPEQVSALAEKGYIIKAYAISAQLFTEEYIEHYDCIAIKRIGTTQYFVRLEDIQTAPCPDAEQRLLPTISLSSLKNSLSEAQQNLSQFEDKLRQLASERIAQLTEWDTLLGGSIQYEEAKQQGRSDASNMLIYLEGWIPTEHSTTLESRLSSSGYYFRKTEITAKDQVPISLKNNVFVRGFELISKMYGLPNYNELDQTALFAPFFMLFFGLCMGDAGYGLLVFLLATYLKSKLKEGDDDTVHLLMQWLGGGAFVIGLLVGSLFGVTLPYATPKDYFLNQDNLMTLSIIVGLLQIFFAKGIAAYKTQLQKGLKFALAPYSWIIFLIAVGAMLGIPHLHIALPSFVTYTLYTIVGISGAIILFYNSPGANPLTNVGSALWAAYNNVSGLLGDTLSYIRLFAIGLTGAVLGGVFNTLAIEQTEGLNILIRLPLMLFALLAGHSINIGLAIIGALVHPIRLTFVEYYKNSEFEGGGIAYNPLNSKTITEN